MNDLFDLSGRVAAITGGSRGLGKEIAAALAEAGADVVIGARTAGDLQAAAAELAEATGRRVLPAELDVTDRAACDAFIGRAIDEMGRLDILVNSAGTNVRSFLADIRDEDFHRIMQVNTTGTFYCCRAAAEPMVETGFGRIVNIGSALSKVGLSGRVSYCSSKGAVLQMTRTMALDLATTGVTVNCLCPGPFATEINRPVREDPEASAKLIGSIPMGRWGELPEIRTAVLFLVSPASGYVTGSAVSVDGGWTAW